MAAAAPLLFPTTPTRSSPAVGHTARRVARGLDYVAIRSNRPSIRLDPLGPPRPPPHHPAPSRHQRQRPRPNRVGGLPVGELQLRENQHHGHPGWGAGAHLSGPAPAAPPA